MNEAAFTENLRGILRHMGTGVDGAAEETLAQFYALVCERNETLNLTAIAEADAPLLNFADSLAALPHIKGAASVCDIGSGAGFPGVVLAIARPDVAFALLEARKKRAEFLQDAARELGLKNVTVAQLRAEDAGRDATYRGRFDIVTARALAAAPVLCEYAMPLLRTGGRMVAYKGTMSPAEAEAARRALELLGGANARTEDAGVPSLAHTFFIAEKIGPTPEKYPRRAGVPEKKPIA